MGCLVPACRKNIFLSAYTWFGGKFQPPMKIIGADWEDPMVGWLGAGLFAFLLYRIYENFGLSQNVPNFIFLVPNVIKRIFRHILPHFHAL